MSAKWRAVRAIAKLHRHDGYLIRSFVIPAYCGDLGIIMAYTSVTDSTLEALANHSCNGGLVPRGMTRSSVLPPLLLLKSKELVGYILYVLHAQLGIHMKYCVTWATTRC